MIQARGDREDIDKPFCTLFQDSADRSEILLPFKKVSEYRDRKAASAAQDVAEDKLAFPVPLKDFRKAGKTARRVSS